MCSFRNGKGRSHRPTLRSPEDVLGPGFHLGLGRHGTPSHGAFHERLDGGTGLQSTEAHVPRPDLGGLVVGRTRSHVHRVVTRVLHGPREPSLQLDDRHHEAPRLRERDDPGENPVRGVGGVEVAGVLPRQDGMTILVLLAAEESGMAGLEPSGPALSVEQSPELSRDRERDLREIPLAGDRISREPCQCSLHPEVGQHLAIEGKDQRLSVVDLRLRPSDDHVSDPHHVRVHVHERIQGRDAGFVSQRLDLVVRQVSEVICDVRIQGIPVDHRVRQILRMEHLSVLIQHLLTGPSPGDEGPRQIPGGILHGDESSLGPVSTAEVGQEPRKTILREILLDEAPEMGVHLGPSLAKELDEIVAAEGHGAAEPAIGMAVPREATASLASLQCHHDVVALSDSLNRVPLLLPQPTDLAGGVEDEPDSGHLIRSDLEDLVTSQAELAHDLWNPAVLDPGGINVPLVSHLQEVADIATVESGEGVDPIALDSPDSRGEAVDTATTVGLR